MEAAALKARLDALCEQAQADARAGDTALVNKLGNVPALDQYFKNVHTFKNYSYQTWASYVGYVRAAEDFFEQLDVLEEAEADKARIATLEGQMAELLKRVESLTEAQTETPAPKKNGKGKKADEDAETEGDGE